MRQYTQVAMERLYGFFHYLCGLTYDIFFRGEVTGLENLPESGAFLIAANHASFLDPILIGCQVPRQMCFFARKSLWKPGLASWWLDGVGTIPVDRDGAGDVSAIKRVLRALASGKVMILFPEGTRSKDGNLQKAKPGVGMIVCRTQVPVVPVRIFGSYEALGKSGRLRIGQPVSITFGPPVQPAVYDPGTGKDRYEVASERIMVEIAKLREPEPIVI